MADEVNTTLSEQVAVAKAQAWAHADGQAAVEAVRWTIDRYKGAASILSGERLAESVRESAEAYLIAKGLIQGAASGGITQLEVNTIREQLHDDAKLLVDRKVKALLMNQALRPGEH